MPTRGCDGNMVCAGLRNLWWRRRNSVCARCRLYVWPLVYTPHQRTWCRINNIIEFAHMSPITYANKAIPWAILPAFPTIVLFAICNNLQIVILDKSRAYTRGNRNFQFVALLINCSLKKIENRKYFFLLHITRIFSLQQYANHL